MGCTFCKINNFIHQGLVHHQVTNKIIILVVTFLNKTNCNKIQVILNKKTSRKINFCAMTSKIKK